MRTLLLLIALPLFAAPISPQAEEGAHVRRVPDRHERIDLVFSPAEEWHELSHETNAYVETRRFISDAPTGDPAMAEATVTIFHDLWDFDMEQAQHLFGKQISADCEGLKAQLLFEDANPPRRLLHYRCESESPFSMLQLMLQGRDHFFTVELLANDGLMPEGQALVWVEWLKAIRPCTFEDPEKPCPDGIWSY
jgi:hypothetical protein